jgi:hypothetical protein
MWNKTPCSFVNRYEFKKENCAFISRIEGVSSAEDGGQRFP